MFESINKYQRWILAIMCPIIFFFFLILCNNIIQTKLKNKIYAEFGCVESGNLVFSGSQKAKANDKLNQLTSFIYIFSLIIYLIVITIFEFQLFKDNVLREVESKEQHGKKD